jgi:hypothetical protein
MRDLVLVTDMTGDSAYSYLEPSGWEDDEPRCKLGIQISRER